MAAATSSSFAQVPLSSSISKTLKPVSKPFTLGFAGSFCKGLNPLRAAAISGVGFSGGSTLGAKMVSVPAIKPLTCLDFDTKVFSKEKVNLAGHEEVLFARSVVLIDYVLNHIGLLNVCNLDCSIL